MSAPLWVQELARTFWEQVGVAELFPRELRRSIIRTLPVTVVLLPELRLDRVRVWLRENGIVCPSHEADRLLRACLVARSGHGIIFVDSSDSNDEQRFSLAHELAHFLRHYEQPRRRAVAHFGEHILDVLDGKRPPTAEERIQALLRNVGVSMHLHLLARDEGRRIASPTVAAAEAEADWLACELLAPSGVVLPQTRQGTARDSRQEAERLLQVTYGLPSPGALWYAAQLYPPLGDAFLSQLGISS
jgi:IrrE N-terminal-like domain